VWSTIPFVVRSQDDKHPFYVSAHMTGCSYVGGCGGQPGPHFDGDPEVVNVVATEQYLSEYVFVTDPTYEDTNLVLVRAKGPNGFEDVMLDCVGKVQGWLPIDNAGTYELARVDLVVDSQPQGNCDNGPHEAHSAAPFALTVWGWSNVVSYAYPAGMGVKPINTVVVPPIPK
jgi:hypothetical protein